MPTINVGGLEMYYEMEGAGAPVVFISGLSGDHLAWAMQVPAVAAAGYRCLVFDSRDTGQTAQSPTPYTIRQLADDTAGLMAALGLSRAHIVGASMGGMIAQEIALHYPERVSSLTLVCTGTSVDPVTAGILRAWRVQRPHGSPEDFVLSLSAWIFTYRFYQQIDAVQGFLQMVGGNPFPQTAAGFQRQCDAVLSHDTERRVASITAPTHVIVGAEDNLTPPRHARALAGQIAGATLTEIPAAGHGLFWEQAEAFNTAVLQFLNGQPAGAAASV
jgi:pimeloyl-ACP methyl ester carboxylesterase